MAAHTVLEGGATDLQKDTLKDGTRVATSPFSSSSKSEVPMSASAKAAAAATAAAANGGRRPLGRDRDKRPTLTPRAAAALAAGNEANPNATGGKRNKRGSVLEMLGIGGGGDKKEPGPRVPEPGEQVSLADQHIEAMEAKEATELMEKKKAEKVARSTLLTRSIHL